VIAFILALALLLQGAPGGRGGAAQGAVTGQIQTRDGQPASAVRVAAIPAPPPVSGIRPDDGIQYYVAPPPVRFRVVAYDCGIKFNILRQLRTIG